MNTIFKPHDEWEPYIDIDQHGKLTLSNIEFTTTNLCNMRCSHCAVGYTLLTKELPPFRQTKSSVNWMKLKHYAR